MRGVALQGVWRWKATLNQGRSQKKLPSVLRRGQIAPIEESSRLERRFLFDDFGC